MVLSTEALKNEINLFCEKIESINETAGWICSLGHGINKSTPEKNVHIFIEEIRKNFS